MLSLAKVSHLLIREEIQKPSAYLVLLDRYLRLYRTSICERKINSAIIFFDYKSNMYNRLIHSGSLLDTTPSLFSINLIRRAIIDYLLTQRLPSFHQYDTFQTTQVYYSLWQSDCLVFLLCHVKHLGYEP